MTLFLVIGIIGASVGNSKPGIGPTTSSPRAHTAAHKAGSSAIGEEDNLNAPGAHTAAGYVVPAGAGKDTGSSGCRTGNPLANVYHPNRLKVLMDCVTVSGVVKSVTAEDDGDVHFDIALDPAYTQMLTLANYSHQHGRLVVEIVPADRTGCTPGQPPKPPHGTYDFGICSGADESPPRVGSHVFVTGPYVLDEDHGGWAEVHPAWAISGSLKSAATTTTAPPPPTTEATTEPTVIAAPPATQAPAPEPPPTSPPATSPPTTSPPPPPPGAWCSASAAPANNGYPGDYEVYVNSNQPDTEATASDAGDTWSHETDSTGYADILLYNTSPGEPITVTVGGASCSTTA